MGKVIRHLRDGQQKNVVKLLDSISGRFSRWEIWQDFIIMSAISIANTIGGPYREQREKEYLSRAGKYTEKEISVFAQMLAEVVDGMDKNPDQDFLGELFMALDLGNERKGQFFTPYNVCRMMAAVTYGDDLRKKIEEQGWVSVNDPACGAGALLVAFANECRRPGRNINYQTSVLFVAQDIDFLAGCMCYIQLSLLGCPGYVVIADTLAHPATCLDTRGLIPVDGPNVWYTPFYCRDEWYYRRLWAQMDLAWKAAAPLAEAEQPTPEPLATPAPALNETKAGQLTLF